MKKVMIGSFETKGWPLTASLAKISIFHASPCFPSETWSQIKRRMAQMV
jgi:hypothetical protein